MAKVILWGMIKCFMGNNKEDYFEYIDIITGTIRRKRTGLFPRDNENIFIADNNITIPKSVKDKLGDKIQNALPLVQKSSITLPKPLCNHQASIIFRHQNILINEH